MPEGPRRTRGRGPMRALGGFELEAEAPVAFSVAADARHHAWKPGKCHKGGGPEQAVRDDGGREQLTGHREQIAKLSLVLPKPETRLARTPSSAFPRAASR